MRRAMICVSMMLALLQLWPLVFGHKLPSTEAAAAESPHLAPAGDRSKPVPAAAFVAAKPLISVAMTVPENCYHHYQRAFKSCDINSQSCQLGAADKWDLCEATGFWQE